MGPGGQRAEARGPTEEGLLQPPPDRVRAHPLRDPDGRHQVQEVQAEQGHGGRQHTAPSEEGRARGHPGVHPVKASAEEGRSYSFSV